MTSLPMPRRSDVKSGPASLAAAIICCWLLSVGVLVTMKQLFRFHNPVPMVMLRAAVVIALLTLISLRWRITAAAVVAIVIVGGIIGNFTGFFDGFFDFAGGIAAWWMALFPSSSEYNTLANIEIVHWIITVVFCSIMFIMVRVIRLTVEIAFFTAILFIIITVSGFRENFWAIAFTAAGLLIMACTSNYVALMHKSFISPAQTKRVAALCLSLCLILAMTARIIVPSDTSGWTLPSFNSLWNSTPFSRPQQGHSSLMSGTFGLQPNPAKLGGDIDLPHTPVLSALTLSAPTLLKGSVYSDYTGTGWERGESTKINIPVRETYPFRTDMPPRLSALDPYIMPSGIISITLLQRSSILFSEGSVTNIALSGSRVLPLANKAGELRTDTILPAEQKYSASAWVIHRELDGFDDAMENFYKTFVGNGSMEASYNDVAGEYLQLPENLPRVIADTALEVTADAASPYEKMLMLERYLKHDGGFTYTTSPGDVPQNVDFVENFLSSKTGYCVYFASAMAVMGRVLDVPTRFVAGYGMEPYGNSWGAYADTAHAWVECYFYGIGWITFDPTAGLYYMTPGQNPDQPATTTTAPANTTTRTPDSTTTTNSPGTTATSSTTESTVPQADNRFSLSPSVTGIIVFAVLFMLMLAAVLLRIHQRARAYTLEYVRRRFNDYTDAADYYYSGIIQQLTLLGYPPQIGETMRNHAARAADSSPDAIAAAFDVAESYRYALHTPEQKELSTLCDSYAALETVLREKLGRVKYFWFRRIL